METMADAITIAFITLLTQHHFTGRFPQVSEIGFAFDCSQKDGSRVSSVTIGGEPIQLKKKYVLATRGYMARGKG